MSIEEKLKAYILERYKSIREFTIAADLPYTTVDNILKRGIANASIGNVLKICNELEISADALAENRITPISPIRNTYVFISDIPRMLDFMRSNLSEYADLTIDGTRLSSDELELLLDHVEMGIKLIRRQRERLNFQKLNGEDDEK